MKNIIYFLFALFAITTGCEDVIELEVPEGRTRLVVDGLVTDASATQTVKLKYTAPYFSNTSTPAVTGAEVFITDNEDNKFLLEESEAGFYQADFQAQVGKSYSLYIKTAEGKEYQSPMQRMEEVASLDSIHYKFVEKSVFNEEEGYVVTIECSDIKGQENYFRWRYFINGEYQSKPEDLFFAADKFVDGSDGLTVTFWNHLLQEGDHARVEQMSISKEAFNFLNLFRQQISGNGQFETPPAPIKGNVINLADPEDLTMGFFMVSSVVSKEVEISGEE